jgi:hypothetical protein
MTKEQIKLHMEWHNVFGTDMPQHVERLPMEEQRKAIEYGRQKHGRVTEAIGSDDSMTEWDGHKEF